MILNPACPHCGRGPSSREQLLTLFEVGPPTLTEARDVLRISETRLYQIARQEGLQFAPKRRESRRVNGAA